MAFIAPLVKFVTKPCITLPTSEAISGEEKIPGKMLFNGEIKLIFWDEIKTPIDWFKTTGVKNQIGNTNPIIKIAQTKKAERFLFFNFF